MNRDGVSALIAVFTFVYVLTLVPTLFGLFSRKSRKIWLHVANVPLHTVHGVLSILLYSDLRRHAGHVGYPPGSSSLFLGTGIRGCVGIILPAWYILAWCISGVAPQSFYLIPANLLFVACFTVSAVLTNTSLPLLLDQCDNLRPEAAQIFAFVRQAKGDNDEVDGCRQVFLVQTLTILVIALMIAQTIYICRRIQLPTPFRAIVLYMIRLVRSLVWSRHGTFRDLEKGSSKHGCSGGRSECWACYKIICQHCQYRHSRSGLRTPRTDNHIENCFAICTKCYLLKLKGSEHPASFAATLHSDDLSLQHQAPACPHDDRPEKQGRNAKFVSCSEIMLCGSCGPLNNSEVTAARERKEMAAYQLPLKRRINCSYCAAALPKEKKRWWICEAGRHECHWEGHEVEKDSQGKGQC